MLIAWVRRQPVSVSCSSGAITAMPALFTSTSSVPSRRTTSSTTRFQSPSLVAS